MKPILKMKVTKSVGGDSFEKEDFLVVEEPLEIRLAFGKVKARQQKCIAITMRTPGHDFELATGFLLAEGIIETRQHILKMKHVPTLHPSSKRNIILIELNPATGFELKKLERHFYTSAACGVCGKTSIEAVWTRSIFNLPEKHPLFRTTTIRKLPQILLKRQSVFSNTGGLHAAALFDSEGNLLLIREDIGRHNAVDKLVGFALEKGLIPLSDYLILVSGRIGFELVQKSLMAGAPIIAAVGAPSSLAVELAAEAGMTLIGFLRNDTFNIYAGESRVVLP